MAHKPVSNKNYKQAYCSNVYIVNRYTTVKPLWYNLGLLETTTLKGFTTKIALPPLHVRRKSHLEF